MSFTTQQRQALAELDEIAMARAKVSAKLHAERKIARRNKDRATVQRISDMRKKLGRAQVRINTARRRILAAGDLSQATARLAGLSRDADKARRNLEDLAELFAGAATVLRILTQLSGVFR